MPNSLTIANLLALPKSDQPIWFALVATPLSWVYAGLGHLRRKLFGIGVFSSESLPGFTISVGNIAVGGTGKTPVVIAIAQALQERGERPAILTRGYKSGLTSQEWGYFLEGIFHGLSGDRSVFADEARMQSHALPQVPIIVGVRRWEAARQFLDQNPQRPITHWILDDGFQHLAIKRDLDLVLLDGEKPFGNGSVLPRGLLRESPSALRYSHGVIWTRPQSFDFPLDLPCPQFLAPFRFVGPWDLDRNPMPSDVPFLLVAGIAAPERILKELKPLGLTPYRTLFVGDHQTLTSGMILENFTDCGAVVTTAKDYYRDPRVFLDLGRSIYLIDVLALLDPTLFSLIP